MKKVAIVQSNYIPWKGYFDLINSVDEFILLDEVQFTRRDWRNRNRIKTPAGPVWLTIPVRVKGKYFQKISETEVSDPGWAEHHWKTLTANYGRAPHFSAFCEVLERSYLECNESHLSLINRRFLDAICQILGIGTRIVDSATYGLVEGKTRAARESLRAGKCRCVCIRPGRQGIHGGRNLSTSRNHRGVFRLFGLSRVSAEPSTF